MKEIKVRYVTNLNNILGITAIKLYPAGGRKYFWSTSYEGERIKCNGRAYFQSIQEAETNFLKEFSSRISEK